MICSLILCFNQDKQMWQHVIALAYSLQFFKLESSAQMIYFLFFWRQWNRGRSGYSCLQRPSFR